MAIVKHRKALPRQGFSAGTGEHLCVDRCWVDVHKAAVLSTILETDDAIRRSEEGVVLAAADVCAGLEWGASLTNDDAAAENALTAEYLDSEPLCV